MIQTITNLLFWGLSLCTAAVALFALAQVCIGPAFESVALLIGSTACFGVTRAGHNLVVKPFLRRQTRHSYLTFGALGPTLELWLTATKTSLISLCFVGVPLACLMGTDFTFKTALYAGLTDGQVLFANAAICNYLQSFVLYLGCTGLFFSLGYAGICTVLLQSCKRRLTMTENPDSKVELLNKIIELELLNNNLSMADSYSHELLGMVQCSKR